MKKIVIYLINIYQKIPLKSHTACPFIPTCSEYTKQAIEKYGIFIGSYKGMKRIFRCHPWQKGGYDPIK